MSTLNVENIQHPSSSTPAISLDSNGAMTGSFPYPNRNLIYNGAMQVHQRGTSTASITSAGYYTADRWAFICDSMGTWTHSIENDAPSGSGLSKSLKILCTTADAAPAAADRIVIRQLLEGYDVQRIAKGTSAAQQLTLSFWTKSNVTGTYVVVLIDNDNNRHVAASYSISSSATWEKKTITFPADTTGVFDNDNAASFQLQMWLGAGSTWNSGTLATSWATNTAANTYVGGTNLAANTNNYWQITGVQLETGSVATEFEHEPYATTLAKCQRYYWREYGTTNYSNYGIAMAFSTTIATMITQCPVEMRSQPTSVEYSGLGIHNPGNTIATITGASIVESMKRTISINFTTDGTIVTDSFYFISNVNNTNGYLGVSAEL